MYEAGYKQADVNAVANFCFLTQDTNLVISADSPAKYFAQVEKDQPGALASQWIPMDRQLWGIDRYSDFLQARRVLLAEAANKLLVGLLTGTAEQPALHEAMEPSIVVGPAQKVENGRAAQVSELVAGLLDEGYAQPDWTLK